MIRVKQLYIVVGLLLGAGILAVLYQAAQTPGRWAQLRRKENDRRELQRLAASREDIQQIMAALDRLPESAPASLDRAASAWPEGQPVLSTETKQMLDGGWAVLRASVTFDHVEYEQIGQFLARVGEADRHPPWRLIEITLAPSAPGRGQAVLTLEALRKVEKP